MKKILFIIMIISAGMSITSCNQSHNKVGNTTSTSDSLSQIFEIEGFYNEDDPFNHTNVISDDIIYSTEKSVGELMTVQMAGESWNLSYENTMLYPVGGYKVNKYKINGSENGSVLLKEDGSIFAVLNSSITTLDISPNDTSETVRTVLEPTVANLIDLSKYQNLRVDGSSAGDETHFGYYYFEFYNTINGYISDCAAILVLDDGTVTTLKIWDIVCESNDLNFHIDKKREEELILAKVMNLLDGQNVEYQNHEIISTPEIVNYNNELCINYSIGIQVNEKTTQFSYGFACRILIPVRLLSDASTVN